ncbi:UPF0149 family protein, partial [Salmonella enterica]|uniref:UPF0149 family protein n=1 Tax=Salmonella enterica TaxID=28901 RepID=UPI00398C4B4E
MEIEPLHENEREWLDDVLPKYHSDQAILDVAELDGLITAVLSSPRPIDPEQWLVAIYGGPASVPRCTSQNDLTRFIDLAFHPTPHTHPRLEYYRNQYEQRYGGSRVDDHDDTM